MEYFLDTETTGTSDQDAVVEVSVLDENGTNHLTTLVSPLAPVRDSAREVHGIEEASLSAAPSFEAVAPRLCQLLTGDYVEALWAYNADFDRRMLVQTAELAGASDAAQSIPRFPWRDLMVPVATFLDEETWVSLSEAAGRMGLAFPDDHRHRAHGDAELARRVWIHINNHGSLPEPSA